MFCCIFLTLPSGTVKIPLLLVLDVRACEFMNVSRDKELGRKVENSARPTDFISLEL